MGGRVMAGGEGGDGEGGCRHYGWGDMQSDDGVVVLLRALAE